MKAGAAQPKTQWCNAEILRSGSAGPGQAQEPGALDSDQGRVAAVFEVIGLQQVVPDQFDFEFVPEPPGEAHVCGGVRRDILGRQRAYIPVNQIELERLEKIE